jgi:arsenite methyltransferase
MFHSNRPPAGVELPVIAASEPLPLDVERAVRERYSAASRRAEPSLCAPVAYDRSLLAVLPVEILERDYGCGDPSRHVAAGETVLDLGSGGGKLCYIAAQIVGPSGRVIGVDRNDDMLALARRHQDEIAQRLGYRNVEFRKGSIQDLALDLETFEAWLADNSIHTSNDWLRAESQAEVLRKTRPMIADASIDVVVSNCVLNLVAPRDRRQLLAEIHRVLRPGGRAVISDIVSDEPIPERLQQDPTLWSGCISGAMLEQDFAGAFEAAGFHGLELVDRQAEPWARLEGIELRSITLRAYKRAAAAPRVDRGQAAIYRGPWRSVEDDDGVLLRRGVPVAICDQTYERYRRNPYAPHVALVAPADSRAGESAPAFERPAGSARDVAAWKQAGDRATTLPLGGCCGGESCGDESITSAAPPADADADRQHGHAE